MKKSELKQIIREEIQSSLKNDRSKKNRFLGIFGPGKDVFQRIIKKVDPSEVESLITYTEANGDSIERYNKSVWGMTKESRENGQSVWQYDGENLMFVNKNYPSIYDTYIRNNF
jgi:hypothetical protein